MSDEADKITQETGSEEVHENGNGRKKDITYLPGMYENWFLDYASYVILERAVPHLYDGLKPVQRRILFAMRRLEDGRFNKVANIIGHTMQFHPHGDTSIGDALVQMGQKDLLVECQGNWGNILTGDGAAASRYIEARLSKFALEVVFNPKTTDWKASYDGRNKEPVYLPVKFPLLLAQGVEGIAVGLASKILPHNFVELIDASIAHLKNQSFELMPDFPTGGLIDCSKYQDGHRGGKIRVRARIEKYDKKTLVVKEIPYGKTTSSVIDTILAANDKGKIRIRKIDDNTAAEVEILIHLAPGVSPDKTIDALYAFTDCEVSISPNTCVVNVDRPEFLGVSEILRISAENSVALLKLELDIRKSELEEDWHASSLEKIFIENRIYLKIEKCETWESIIQTIDKGLDPFKDLLKREVTKEDIVKLTELKIKRISKYDAKRAEEHLLAIEEELKKVNFHLDHLIEYAIAYFQNLKKKYSKGRERKSEIRSFDTIEATRVVVANQKLYVNYEEGFVGTSLKKDTFLFECSDIDDIIIFRKDGTYLITKVSNKAFLGKNILHIGIFDKNDTRTIFNVVYRDGKVGHNYVKRFVVKGVTRDKEYDLSQGTAGSRILYFTENPNGEAEVIRVGLKPKPKLKKALFDFDFGDLAIKNRNAMGNILSKHSINKISLKEKGASTLGGRKIWFDSSVNRLNDDERGLFLGEFLGEDRLLVILKDGRFRLTGFDLSGHFEENILIIEKFDPRKVFSVVLYDADQEYFYLKRFQIEEETTFNRLQSFIGDNPESKLVLISDHLFPNIQFSFKGKHEHREPEIVKAAGFIALKSFKARGKRLSSFEVDDINELEPTQPTTELITQVFGEEFLAAIEIDDETDNVTETEDDIEFEIVESTESDEPFVPAKPADVPSPIQDKAQATEEPVQEVEFEKVIKVGETEKVVKVQEPKKKIARKSDTKKTQTKKAKVEKSATKKTTAKKPVETSPKVKKNPPKKNPTQKSNKKSIKNPGTDKLKTPPKTEKNKKDPDTSTDPSGQMSLGW